MSEDGAMDSVAIAVMVLAQWTATASSLWLTWWAAQSRDPLALRVIALVLVIIPAVISPLLTLPGMAMSMSVSERAMMISLFFGGFSVLRAILLFVWAIISKDRADLRIIGGLIALLLVVLIGVQMVSYAFH
jgi:hypothetical protein